MASRIAGKGLRLALISITALAALLLLAALLARQLVDTGDIRVLVESRLSEQLNKTVNIGEVSHFSLLWWPVLSFENIAVSRDGHEVASIDRAQVWLSPVSLLNGQPRARTIQLEGVVLTIERLGSEAFNLFERGAPPRERRPLDLKQLQVRDAQLQIRDRVRELAWQLPGCRLDLAPVRHPGGHPGQILAGLETAGSANCAQSAPVPAWVNDLSVDIQAANGLIEVGPVDATILQGKAEARFSADLSGAVPVFDLRYRLLDMATAPLTRLLDGDHPLLGEMSLDTSLQAEGATWQAVRKSLAGRLSITGQQLILEGIDLDAALENYADTQRFNLVDVGAVFLAGPLGLLASRGYALSGLLEENEGSTRIGQVVSTWQLEAGLATAQDVAFSTEHSRLALTGAIDLGAARIEEIRVAVVDEAGCARVEQALSGPLNDPEIARPEVLALVTVIGPVLDLLEQGAEAIADVDCQVFYDGSVPHP